MDVRLENNTWEEVAELIKASKGTAIIPIGSIEQHGKHLPVGTDSFVANKLAEEGAEKTGAILVPPVWFGWSPHHMVLPGSITIRPEILQGYVYDIIESLATHGVKKFVLINGHRIVNIVWMQLLAQKAQQDLGVIIKLFDPAYMSKDIVGELGFGPVGHADEIETSHMMHMMEDLVHLDRAEDLPITGEDLYSVDPNYAHDTLCYVPSTLDQAQEHADKTGGANGEPSKSCPDKGKIYHDHLIDNLVRVVEKLQDQ